MNRNPQNKLHLGAAYYPEHWPETRWPEDIRLMAEAEFTVVRMAEFAWSTMEPEAGRFDLDWLERAIELLAEAGIATVLGTPTAAPPAWLTQQHPSIFAVDENGRRLQHGNRCHYCVNSAAFHEATQSIVSAMAARFGPNPNVIGWQLDNEYHRVCYCDHCRALFQEYLQAQYGSLDALNEHWATRYWSQTYSAWEQIPLPAGPHNPGLRLAFMRFVTESYRRFQRLQLDALRPHLPDDVWVTHNFMGWFGGFDHYKIAEDLDLASFDCYFPEGRGDYLSTGARHDLTRGFKRQNFWVMETQPGNVNWAPANSSLNRGETRAMAWHAVAHGADAVLYWQWRSALGGQEQYHGTLVDQAGLPRPIYEEVRRLGEDFEAVADLLAGTQPKARVAMLNDYESRWSVQWQPHHADFDYVEHFTHYYRAIAAKNVAVDVIPTDAPLSGYSLVIAPALIIVDEALVARLEEYVKRGGYLILTARTGMKDRHNALLPARPPGPLSEMAGVQVEEYYALREPVPVIGNFFTGESRIWAERLQVLDEELTTVVARYGPANGWLDDQIAITVHPYGRGMVYYVGVYLDEAAQEEFISFVLRLRGLKQKLEAPPGVEICQRFDEDKQPVWIVINHEPTVKRIKIPWFSYEHINQTSGSGSFRLMPYGVLVLTKRQI